jgi:hypothetical protein
MPKPAVNKHANVGPFGLTRHLWTADCNYLIVFVHIYPSIDRVDEISKKKCVQIFYSKNSFPQNDVKRIYTRVTVNWPQVNENNKIN